MLQINTKSGKFDPAPSKLRYRLNRFWFKRSSKLLVFVILPALMLCFVFSYFFKNQTIRESIFTEFSELKEELKLRPALQVTGLKVVSPNPEIVSKISAIINFEFPVSSLNVDVDLLRGLVQNLDSVEVATVRIKSGGLLEVNVTEREPVVVQKIGKRLLLLDKQGITVDEIFSRSDRLDLPLLAGHGVQDSVEEALKIIIATGPLISRVRGLIRVGGRRWTIVLDKSQFIYLPELNPIIALQKVALIQLSDNLLNRDIAGIDLRDPTKFIVRLTDHSANELRKLRMLVSGEDA